MESISYDKFQIAKLMKFLCYFFTVCKKRITSHISRNINLNESNRI